MRPFLSLTASLLISMLWFGAASAQQSETKRARTPQLSSDDISQPASSSSTAGESAFWHRHSPGNLYLSIEFPGAPPSPVEIPYPENLKKLLRDARGYIYNSADWSLTVAYLSGGAPPNSAVVDSVVTGFMDGIKKRPEISNLKYSIEHEAESKLPIKGSFTRAAIPCSLDGMAITNQNDLWLVTIMYPQSSNEARSVARHMLNSVMINQ